MGWNGWDGIHIHGLAWVLRLGSYEMHCWKGYQAVASSMALALFFAVSFAMGMGLFFAVGVGWRGGLPWLLHFGLLSICASAWSSAESSLHLGPTSVVFSYTEYTFTCFVSQDNLSNQLTVIGGSWGFHLLRSSSLCYGPPIGQSSTLLQQLGSAASGGTRIIQGFCCPCVHLPSLC